MNSQHSICSSATIEQFLVDQLTEEEQKMFESHLEGCPSCRQGLEDLAAEGPWWEEARGLLASVNVLALEDAPATPEDQDNEPSLFGLQNYLGPSDDPRMLGRLGGYEIAGVVGCGGMGIVLKGFDAPLNRYVAIKVLAPHLALSGASRQRFAREAKAAAAVVHNNVMAIHAVAETNGLPYLVMPYVPGPSLEKRLRQTGALAIVEILRVGRQIASGLAAAHAQGLVHRDIKPANILLEEGTERVRITDFGLARAVDDASLTRTGVIAGTPQYMSPEQAAGRAVDHRSDLFSLGSVLYALCTGRAPFRADTTLAVLRRVEENRPRQIREINPDVPEWLAVIIQRLHATEPGARLQRAADVAALLEGFLAHLSQPTTIAAPEMPPAPPPVSPGRRAPEKRWRLFTRPLYLLAGLVAVCAVTALAMEVFDGFAAGDGPDPKEGTHEIHLPLRGLPGEGGQGWKLIGPDAESCVKYEPEGLRITLPAGFPGERPGTGLRIPMPGQGDFAVTIGYEILAEPEQANAGQRPTKLTFETQLARRDWTVAAIARRVSSDKGLQFTSWTIRDNYDNTGKRQTKARQHAAQAKVGRLRIVRTGAEISFYAAEGADADFLLLPPPRYVGEEDLKSIELVGSTGAPKARLDVRFTDLRVRTNRAVAPADAPEVQEPATPLPRRAKWILVTTMMAAVLVVATLLSVWLLMRRCRREPEVEQARVVGEEADRSASPTAPLAVRCPGCAKGLKVRAELAGKKLKCPACGKAIVVA